MSRIITMTVVIAGLSLLFYFAGFTTDSASLTTLLLNPQNIADSGWGGILKGGIAATLAVGTIVLGFVTRNIELALAGPIGVIFINFLYESIYIYQVLAASVSPILAILLFSPMIFILGIEVFDWVRGRAT